MAAGSPRGTSDSFSSSHNPYADMMNDTNLSFGPIDNNSLHYANPTPPESVMDEASPLPSEFINPQDISNEGGHYQMGGMSSRATSLSPPPGGADDASTNGESGKKKRKSWGQVLPKPTTNLPPRKRAKTDEEKAQRKYERVQRNRHAAHMSRMRKQDEMENLRRENDRLRIDNTDLEDEIKRLREELGRPAVDIGYAHGQSGFTHTETESTSTGEATRHMIDFAAHQHQEPKVAHQSPVEGARFTMNDLIDFDSLDVESDREETRSAKMASPVDAAPMFNMATGGGMDEYRAADGNDSSLLDEAMNAAILNLPRMMEA